MNKLLSILFILMFFWGNAQKENLNDIQKAHKQIIKLKEEGALIVRLHLSRKKINLYRNAGNIKLADKLQKELDFNNYALTTSFLDSTFTFCPVYFINAKDYGRLINGEKSGYFLNNKLEIDSSIVMTENYFFFVDRGPVYEQVGKSNSFSSSVTSSTPVIQDALVLKDISMDQLVKPFPFYKNITFQDNIKTEFGFYIRKYKDDAGKWHKAQWLYSNKLKNLETRNLKFQNFNTDLNTIFSGKNFIIDKPDMVKYSKNISIYYSEKYHLDKKSEQIIPFNVYRLNVKLYRFYLKVKGK